MQNAEYWRRRAEILEAAKNKSAGSYTAAVEQQFNLAQKKIDEQIEQWYGRFAKNNQITLSEARQWLTGKDLAEFKWDVTEYIKYGKDAMIDPAFMKQLENASARFHVSKLEALKLKTQATVEQLYGQTAKQTTSLFGKIYTDNYYHTAFELQKGVGVGWDVASLNPHQIESTLSKPWTLDKQTFSDRIWKQKNDLLSEVHTQLTQNMILGKAPDDAIKAISKKFNTSKSNAGRLVMTESAYFATEAQRKAFETLDVEEYEIVATLDSLTSAICQSMDGEHFPMSQFEPGVTAPPFHPWCRTAVAPYFADDEGERVARDEETGKSYYVPQDMKYKDWKKTFVDGGSKDGLKPTNPSDIISKPLYPKEIAGVMRGQPMTRDDANHGKPNPNFKQSHGYRVNCQSCVVAYEARLRGYDVQTLPNVKGSKLAELARQTNMAWIDPATGKYPAYIFDDTATTVKKFQTFIENTVEKDKRYTLQFSWKGRSRSGHIISMDRDDLGALRLYDPQTGHTYTGKHLNTYLGQLKYTMSLGGMKVSTPPKILRVDDKEFNLDVVNHIMEGVTK